VGGRGEEGHEGHRKGRPSGSLVRGYLYIFKENLPKDSGKGEKPFQGITEEKTPFIAHPRKKRHLKVKKNRGLGGGRLGERGNDAEVYTCTLAGDVKQQSLRGKQERVKVVGGGLDGLVYDQGEDPRNGVRAKGEMSFATERDTKEPVRIKKKRKKRHFKKTY